VKDDNGEEGDRDTRYDEVDGVEQSLATDRDVERDVRLWLWTAVEALDVFTGWHAEYVPLHADVKVLQIHALLDHIRDPGPTRLLIYMNQVHLYTQFNIGRGYLLKREKNRGCEN